MLRSLIPLGLSLMAPFAGLGFADPRPGGVEVPVRTCAYDSGWIRPTEDEMEASIWRDNRYGGVDGQNRPFLRAYHQRPFFLYTTVTLSGTGRMLDQSGLWTARLYGTEFCENPRIGLDERRDVVIWVVGHDVVGAAIEGERLFVVVEAHESTDRGYHVVRVARPSPDLLRVRFVLPDGQEIARADGANLFGPVPPIVLP